MSDEFELLVVGGGPGGALGGAGLPRCSRSRRRRDRQR